ncbi:hypothetical protein QR680_014183 [Steinernema hermaphroditum]|uniref:G-protein coupled receptors family 1 profile domain-containing protein n=1 Tax=Steinernema hermaphroditum TaxID=289476 RepID=A0AA39I7Z7_9BILA|nr:hypothetical protein QR680_014183 [Steinernema hermaphroditum]
MALKWHIFDFRTENRIYLVLGSLATAANLSVVLLILATEALRQRKEFILIIGFCLVDAITGIDYVLISIYRNSVLTEGRESELTSRLFCNVQPSQILSLICDQLLVGVVTVSTVDRVVAVFKPVFYYKLSVKCAWFIIAFLFVQAGLVYVIVHLATLDAVTLDVPILCYTAHSADAYFYALMKMLRITVVTTSLLLYIPIIVKLYKYTKTNTVAAKTRLKKIKKITVTVVLATSTDMVFILIPDVLLVSSLFGFRDHAVVLLHLSKCILTVVVCVSRHKEIGEALVKRCKKIVGKKVTTAKVHLIATF